MLNSVQNIQNIFSLESVIMHFKNLSTLEVMLEILKIHESVWPEELRSVFKMTGVIFNQGCTYFFLI